MTPLRSLIVEVVLQGMDNGEFRQMDAQVVAHSLLLPMFMLCLQQSVMDTGTLADRRLDEGIIPLHVELVIQGLAPDPGHPAVRLSSLTGV